MSEFTKLVAKFKKEDDGDILVKAEKDQPILKSKLEAKLKATEAKEMEKKADLDEAEDKVLRAKAKVTRDADVWISGVRNAESVRDEAAQQHQDLLHTIEKLKEDLKLFA